MWARIVEKGLETPDQRRGEVAFRLLDQFFDAMIKADDAGAVFNDDVSTAAYDEDDEHPLKPDEWAHLSGVDLNKSVEFDFDRKTYAAEFWARARAAAPDADAALATARALARTTRATARRFAAPHQHRGPRQTPPP